MKDKNHTEITKKEHPNARIGSYSKMHVFQNKSEGESHKSYKKRVAYTQGNRKSVGGKGQFPAFPFSSGEEHKKHFAGKREGKTAQGRALDTKSKE